MDDSSKLLNQARDYQRVAKAIRYISEHQQLQPTLEEIASAVHLSPHHFQRMFLRWAGVSPKQFLGYLTVEHAKRSLEANRSTLESALAAGLSGSGRLHDLFLRHQAMTPGEYKLQGAGLDLHHGEISTAFGDALFLHSPRGLCALEFCDSAESREEILYRWHSSWSLSRISQTRGDMSRTLQQQLTTPDPEQPLGLLLRGTPLQLKVWQALLRIPQGTTCSYGHLAEQIGSPGAARAIGTAIGQNPIAWLIPCHRVLRNNGVVGDYHWSRERKQLMLAREAALRDSTEQTAAGTGAFR